MKNEPVVLFTSCNEDYLKHIPTLLMSIHTHMAEYKIEFYFLHTSIAPEKFEKIRKFSESLGILFEDIMISNHDYEQYCVLKKMTSAESTYPVEGFLDILPNLHLPSHVERALYLDAGDVILAGSIADYYFSDFKGNVLSVSKGFAENWCYTADDLYERSSYLQIGSEYFNAGIVLFNVALMRKLNIDFAYYMSIVKLLNNIHDGYNWNTFGGGKRYVVQDDQGLLGAAFVGHINFFDPQNIGNTNTSYNFRPFVFECNKTRISGVEQWSLTSVCPKIIHLLGNKPWLSQEKREELLPISQECLALWDLYEQQAAKKMEELI